VDKELGRFYNELFEFRQKGDYKDLTEFKREDVKLWLVKGKDFVRRLDEITKNAQQQGEKKWKTRQD
jgi:uncharacterized protein (UPF0332 family)